MTEKNQWAWGLCVAASLVLASQAGAELLAHWKFESDAPFEDAVSRLHLDEESSDTSGKVRFAVSAGKAKQVEEGKASLNVPYMQAVDLRLRVNAPTRGGNPFRLSGTSWTISGWFNHTGDKPTKFGHTIAGTHGYSTLEGRGNAGWSLRAVAEGEDQHKIAAIFSSGGAKPVTFQVVSAEAIETGEGKWNHFGLTWDHDGGAGGAGVARLFINGKAAGEATAPGNFALTDADRNAFRGIWIAGRPTSKAGGGSDNWSGRLDEVKFYAETVGDEAMMLAEYEPKKPEPKPKPKPKPKPAVVAKKKEPAKPPAPPPAPPKPQEKVLEVRVWTDLRGATMEAAMIVPVEGEAGRVLLQDAEGIRFSLPLERLSPEDQAFVASAK